jgi:hypothetical protein
MLLMGKALSEGDLDLIEKQLGLRRRELEDDARAIARVRRMLEESKNGAVQPHLQLSHGGNGASHSDMGFNEAVRLAARATNGAEFTVPMIEAVVRKQGVKMPNKKIRPRISTVLKDLVDKKILVVVRPGHGKTPHVYRTA